jgi:polyphenol oxidase
VKAASTTTADGDMTGRDIGGGDMAALAEARARIAPGPWTTLRQVHGARVVTVSGPGARVGEEADAAVTASGAALAVLTADCAPVALASPEGLVGVAHAGWRGVEAGVLEAAVAALRHLGATEVEAVIGPCIHPECYEFGSADLRRLSGRFGAGVATVDRRGRPALDLPAAARRALEDAGATVVATAPECTSCSGRYWSWRARGETSRQALVVWRP